MTIAVLVSCGSSENGANSEANQPVEDSAATTDTNAQNGGAPAGGLFATALSEAADALEISVEVLQEALGSPPDIEAASQKLEIPVRVLEEVLPEFGNSERGFAVRGEGGFGGGLNVILTEAAEKLEISVDALIEALGRPINLEAAAEKLELTMEQIRSALPEEFGQAIDRRGGRGGFGTQ